MPLTHRRPRKSKAFRICLRVFGKNDVNGDDVGVRTIDAGAEHQIVTHAAKGAIETARDAVGEIPPGVIQQVRTRKFRNAMPYELAGVSIAYFLAVDMDFEIAGKALDPFQGDTLGSVAAIEEGRNDSDTRLASADR